MMIRKTITAKTMMIAIHTADMLAPFFRGFRNAGQNTAGCSPSCSARALSALASQFTRLGRRKKDNTGEGLKRSAAYSKQQMQIETGKGPVSMQPSRKEKKAEPKPSRPEVAPGIKAVAAAVAHVRLQPDQRQQQPFQWAQGFNNDAVRMACATTLRPGNQRCQISKHGSDQRTHASSIMEIALLQTRGNGWRAKSLPRFPKLKAGSEVGASV